MPISPARRNGMMRRRSIAWRSGQVVPIWIVSPPETTRNVAWSGSIQCSQIDVATMPKAKPDAPEASPPRNAPTHSAMSFGSRRVAKSSDHIEQEHEPDGERRREAERDGEPGVLAYREELDRQHAQPERHVQRERDHDHAFRELYQRMTGGAQEALERIGAVERGRERKEMDRQKDRKREASQPMEKRREEARLRVR